MTAAPTTTAGYQSPYLPSSIGNQTYNATPYATPVPGMDTYGTVDAQAIKAYNDAVAGINYNRQQLLAQNGYTANIDPTTGNISDLRVDPYNAYGGLQQMYNTQARNDIAAEDNAVGRGLHGGLAHQSESLLRYDNMGQRQNFGQQLFSNLNAFDQQQGQAAQTRDAALWQSMLAQAQAAIMNGNFNPANYDNSGDNNNNNNDPSVDTVDHNSFNSNATKYGMLNPGTTLGRSAQDRSRQTAARIAANRSSGSAVNRFAKKVK